MRDKTTFNPRTAPADFEILASRFFSIAREMGLIMERTARSPIYFSSRDFISTTLTPKGELISLAQYIPVLVGATPFAVRAVTQCFRNDINQGDIFLVNDPYSYDGGNHLADWCIVYPVFYKGKLIFMIAQKAHQIDTGGGVSGGYNPQAQDIWAEGLRIPPVKIYERGQERKDVLNLILTNVRAYTAQRGDLLSLIGASKIGEKRLLELLDKYGEDAISTYLTDVFSYAEYRMRENIDSIPDGTYHGEVRGITDAPLISADIIIKGNNMLVDLSKSGPSVKEYINSPIANTYSSVWMAILTSLGKKIERQYRNMGCFKPIKILTIPGTVVHAVNPATVGNCTIFVATQIIEAIWDALSKVIPEDVSAGWGHQCGWVLSGLDPRQNERWGSPDFKSAALGAGAIWGTDGWSGASTQIASGACMTPDIEVFENRFPIFMEKWELVTDSCGPGRWRGGCGVENTWLVDAGQEPVYASSQADPYVYESVPAIKGGKTSSPSSKKLIFTNGKEETNAEILHKGFYVLHTGDQAIDFTQGGAGVGHPLERDILAVRDDVRDELVSVKSARDDYGVVIDPVTLEIDQGQTKRMRAAMKKKRAS